MKDDTKLLILIAIICFTIIICIGLMVSCQAFREKEHTKQRLGGITNVEHIDFP